VTEDLARRAVVIELAYFGENLNARHYRHPDLYAFALEHRPALLGALQTLVENWREGGCQPGSRPLASFGRWAAVVGGILEAAGVANPIGAATLTGKENSEAADVRAFLEAAEGRYGNQPFNSEAARKLATEAGLFTWLGDLEERKVQVRLGKLLGRYERRELGGRRLLREPGANRQMYFRVHHL
jgi:hypothetical protein